jgi:hypothetical protein
LLVGIMGCRGLCFFVVSVNFCLINQQVSWRQINRGCWGFGLAVFI